MSGSGRMDGPDRIDGPGRSGGVGRVDRAGVRLLGSVAALLGLAMIAAGGVTLEAPADFAQLFATLGLGASWVVPAGWIEIVIGLLLFYGPTRRYGAPAAAAWIGLAIPAQVGAGQLPLAAGSLAVLVLAATVAVVEVRRRGWTLPEPPAPLADPPTSRRHFAAFAVELVGVSFLIRFAVGGTLFWAALPVLAWFHRKRRAEPSGSLAETLLLYLLVLGIGVSGFWGFVGHFLMSGTVAESVGWATSPFQRELAFYHLGIGVAGLLCLRLDRDAWFVIGVVAVAFNYGAGVVHLQEFLATGNTSPRNWGWSVLAGSVVIPTALAALLAVVFAPPQASSRQTWATRKQTTKPSTSG